MPDILFSDASLAKSETLRASLKHNGFSKFKAKADAGQSAQLLIWSDSTGNYYRNTGRWPIRLAASLAYRYPGHTVTIQAWDDIGNGTWQDATTVQTGSAGASSPVLALKVVAISGKVPQFNMGALWPLTSPPADGVIINHGINYFTPWDRTNEGGVHVRGAMLAAIQQYRSHYGQVPISIVVGNPIQDQPTKLVNLPIYWKQIALDAGVGVVTGIYDAYVAAGLPNAWYDLTDNTFTHPSEPTGNQVWASYIWQHFLEAAPDSTAASAASLLSAGRNLLVNGDFRTWTNTAAAPDGWTAAGGAITFTKDTSVVADPVLGYSVKMIAASTGLAGGRITQTLSGTAFRQQVRNGFLTLAARKRVAVAGNDTVGRMLVVVNSTVAGAVTYTSVNYVERQDGFVWWAIQGIPIPDDVTTVRVDLYADSAGANADAVNAAWWDQACLVQGREMKPARAA